MSALDFNTTLWMTSFIGGLAALAGLFIVSSAHGALPSVSRMTIANTGLAISVIGRVWVGDDVTNVGYVCLLSLWAGTLLALVAAVRVSVGEPASNRRFILCWLGITVALAAAALSFSNPQPIAIVSCIALLLIAAAGFLSALKIPHSTTNAPRNVLVGAFALTAIGSLAHLPVRLSDFFNDTPDIRQTAYTYVLFLGAWLSINIGLVMIQYARLIEDASSLAHTDQLTDLLNRHGLHASLRDYKRRHNESVKGSIVMIDIDHFKKINDTHGHNAGDAVLSSFARQLQRFVRKGDLLVRWGGEEFCLILPGCTVDEGCELANEICRGIASEPLPNEHGLDLTITASFGVASLGADDTILQHDMERADEALYTAKSKGRNRVQRWSQQEACATHPYGQSHDQQEASLTV